MAAIFLVRKDSRARCRRKNVNVTFPVMRVVLETLADKRLKIFPRKNHGTKIMSNFACMMKAEDFLKADSALLFK